MNSSKRILALLWFLMLVNYLDRVALGFAGPAMMRSLGMTPGEFGVILSAFGIGYLLAQFPGGMLADRFGARLLLVVGPLLWALFTGFTALAVGLVTFVLVRICFGLSEGITTPAVYKLIGDNFDSRNRARALAIMSTAIPVAPAFAGALIGKLVGAYGWQAMFVLMTVPSLMVAALMHVFLPSSASHAGEPAGEGRAAERPRLRQLLGSRGLWLLCLAGLAFNMPYWGYLGWMPSYLAIQQHVDLAHSGMVSGIPYVFALGGMLFFGWLASSILHRHPLPLLVGCLIAAALSLGLAYQAPNLATALIGLSAAAFFLFGIHGPIGRVVIDHAPENGRATFIGVYTTSGQLGGLAAPALIGFMVDATGSFAAGFALMIAGFCVSAACLIALQLQDRTRPS